MMSDIANNNKYIDPVDGKLDFSRIPKGKKVKLLILASLAVVLGILLVVGISDWLIAPVSRFADFDNIYMYKVIYMILLFQIVFPLLLLPFNAIYMVMTKSPIHKALQEKWTNITGSALIQYGKTTLRTIIITAPIVVFYTWALQHIFGKITAKAVDGQVYFTMPSMWFSLSLILCVILTKALVTRLLKRLGWAI